MKGHTLMDAEQALAHIVSSSISKQSIREMMAGGFDTLMIAKRYGLKEAEIWNALGAGDDK